MAAGAPSAHEFRGRIRQLLVISDCADTANVRIAHHALIVYRGIVARVPA